MYFQNVVGVHTTTDMGSGQLPSAGWQQAAFVKRVKYVDMTGTLQDATGLTGAALECTCYDLALGSSTDTNWLQYFSFGGPGRVVGTGTWITWPTSAGGNGHIYGLTPTATNWLAAEAIAASYGGTLASITSADEQAFINNSFFVGEFEHLPRLGSQVGVHQLSHWRADDLYLLEKWRAQ